MVRAEALRPIRFAITQLFQFEDWLCWCLLAARGPFLFLDQQLVGYRVHEHASTTAIARSRIRHLYALLEFKIALFARSESSLHGLRVIFSVLESLRMLLVEYLWDPVAGTPPLRRNGLVWLVVGVAKVVALPLHFRPPDR